MSDLAERVRNCINPFWSQDGINQRQTPHISVWPMRKKWEKYGTVWETLGTDGDYEVYPSGSVRIPAVLRLTYFRCHGDRVCQLAEVMQRQIITKQKTFFSAEIKRYERARNTLPKELNV